MKEQNAKGYMIRLILSVIMVALCCCSLHGIVFGIVTIILNIKSNNAYKKGDSYNFKRFRKYTDYTFVGYIIVTIVLTVVGVTGAVLSIAKSIFNGLLSI